MDMTEEQKGKLVALRDAELEKKHPNSAKIACIEKMLQNGADVRSHYLVAGSEPHREIGDILSPKEDANATEKA